MSERIPTIISASYNAKQDEIVQSYFHEWRKLNTDLQRRVSHRDKLNEHTLGHTFPQDLNIKLASPKLPDSLTHGEKEEHNKQEKEIWDSAKKQILALRTKTFSEHVAALRIESNKLRDQETMLQRIKSRTLPPGTDPKDLVAGIHYLITAHEETLELKRNEREQAAAVITVEPQSENISNADIRILIQQLANQFNSLQKQVSQGNSSRPATKAKAGGTGAQKSSTNGGPSIKKGQQNKKQQPAITSHKEQDMSLSNKRGNIRENGGTEKRGKGKQ